MRSTLQHQQLLQQQQEEQAQREAAGGGGNGFGLAAPAVLKIDMNRFKKVEK